MSINIIDIIQKRTPYPPLKKIDPNTQDISGKESCTSIDLMGQAAIPTVLTAVYKHSRNDADADIILHPDNEEDIMSFLFNEKVDEVTAKISIYAGVSEARAKEELEKISTQSITVIKEFLGREATPQKLKSFMNDQRHHILVYLPGSLHMGDLLKDEALDDRTNKMEGPVSNMMHKIENKFSQGGG